MLIRIQLRGKYISLFLNYYIMLLDLRIVLFDFNFSWKGHKIEGGNFIVSKVFDDL